MNTQKWINDTWPEAPNNSLQELDDMVNANFVSKIMLIFKEEEISRKELFSRLHINAGDYLTKDNMKKVFLRSMARAFNKLYGEVIA